MPTTRRQAAMQESQSQKDSSSHDQPKPKQEGDHEAEAGEKRDIEETEVKNEAAVEEPPAKKIKVESDGKPSKAEERAYHPQIGTIERGHIYFFYRPKVQHEEAHSLDDTKNLHMLLVPRPPDFSAPPKADEGGSGTDDAMQVLPAGADAVPSPQPLDDAKQHYRLLIVGKKHMPDPSEGGKGKGRKQIFWATTTAVGDDLKSVEQGFGERTYETKTRGTRHEEPVRLAARGGYAIVNNDPRLPSGRATHFGYSISHPAEMGDVQKALGISSTASFVLQVKNPLAPAQNAQQVHAKGASYPTRILRDVFGKGTKGRESYGLRFASCETPELLDYEGAQLLFIAVSASEEGLERSLGEGRGNALRDAEEKEVDETVETIFRELDMDNRVIPATPLSGEWI